jgi:clan AA aspartic protease (TIGR02281 family)
MPFAKTMNKEISTGSAIAILVALLVLTIGSVAAIGHYSSMPSHTVSLTKDGKRFAVPIEINGAMTLIALIDSGASDINLPADVFNALRRAGTVGATGQATYVLADGSKVRNLTFMIRSLRVGDLIVENVEASVGASESEALLGRSFLGRFKSWSIDNEKRELFLGASLE